MMWRSALGVLYDRPILLKGKLYMIIQRPITPCGTESWAVKHQHVYKTSGVEIRTFYWICEYTSKDWMANDLWKTKCWSD